MTYLQVKTTTPREAIYLLTKRNQEMVFFSRYNFLLKHQGVRPICSHGLIGPMGCGKSTLAKKIAEDCAIGHKVLVWLTEEASEQWETKISKNFERIFFFEEKSLPDDAFKNLERFYFYFSNVIDQEKPSIVIIDNLTTSYMYSDDIGPKGQAESARKLMKIMKKLKTAFFYVAHTKKEITSNFSRVLTPEDIRGSAQITIQSEYLYLFHKFSADEEPISVIRTVKHRYHDNAGGFFLLNWTTNGGFYVSDKPIDFQRMKTIFNSRDVLK